MGAKYRKRQRVRVLSLKNKYAKAKAKDTNVKQYEFETGTIIDNYWAGDFKYGQVAPLEDIPPRSYLYKVRMDKDGNEIAVEEDALEPVVD
jgi:hypothetical protein